jgi:hypothetical protein
MVRHVFLWNVKPDSPNGYTTRGTSSSPAR